MWTIPTDRVWRSGLVHLFPMGSGIHSCYSVVGRECVCYWFPAYTARMPLLLPALLFAAGLNPYDEGKRRFQMWTIPTDRVWRSGLVHLFPMGSGIHSCYSVVGRECVCYWFPAYT